MIVVVTGASRGAGKGIAIALGAAGATVYVTGRSTSDSDTQWGGTIHETAELVTKAGGKGVAVAVDHANDAAVAAFFDWIAKEHGRLDILVNNAVKAVAGTDPGGVWEKPLEAGDLITVRLRSQYVRTYSDSPLFRASSKSLIAHPRHPS